jgi:membrane-bound ClpP family serine protease
MAAFGLILILLGAALLLFMPLVGLASIVFGIVLMISGNASMRREAREATLLEETRRQSEELAKLREEMTKK